jgi:hypothetical protein
MSGNIPVLLGAMADSLHIIICIDFRLADPDIERRARAHGITIRETTDRKRHSLQPKRKVRR